MKKKPLRLLLLSPLLALTWTPYTHAQMLIASGGEAGDSFGNSVSVAGSIALVGAESHDYGTNISQGLAYVFRDLNTATGTVSQNVQLTASDGAAEDFFGSSVSLSGTTGLVGARWGDVGVNGMAGAAYVFRNLDTATGTIIQNAKLILQRRQQKPATSEVR